MFDRHRGQRAECRSSRFWHRRHLPLLISPQVLRSNACGQVDVAVWNTEQRSLLLIEVKSSVGPSRGQMRRLRLAADFLSKIFHCPVSIRIHIESA